jgi:hypothetical protein
MCIDLKEIFTKETIITNVALMTITEINNVLILIGM